MWTTSDGIKPRSYYENDGVKLFTGAFSALNNTLSGISSGVSATVLNLLSGLSVQASQINYATSFPSSAAYSLSAAYAVSASTAQASLSAVTAARATTADNAHYASLAGTAVYATLAGTAAYSVSATYAASALFANSASYANSAGLLSGLAISASLLNTILYGSTLYKYAAGSVIASNGMLMTHGLNTGLYGFVSPCTGGVMAGISVSGTAMTFYIQANAGIFFETTSATVSWIVIGN